jgi:hypothetical protein
MSVIPTDFTSFAPERASSASAIPATDSKPAVIDAASSLVYNLIFDLTNLNFIDPPPDSFISTKPQARLKRRLKSE